MVSQQYLTSFLLTALLTSGLVAVTNYYSDPLNYFHDSAIYRDRNAHYVRQLLQQDRGLAYSGPTEQRFLKVELATRDRQCYILGSSRIDQFSELRKGPLQEVCETSMNLGVPSATIEDYVILADKLRNKTNSKMILAIDPWLFKIGMHLTPGWTDLKSDFIAATEFFELSKHEEPPISAGFVKDVFKKVFTLQVSIMSVRKTIKTLLYALKSQDPKKSKEVIDSCDLLEGCDFHLTLKDGSHVRSREALKKNTNAHHFFFASDRLIDLEAVHYLKTVVKHFQAGGNEVIFLLVPYNPRVFANSADIAKRYILPMETFANELAAELSVDVVGSYDPQVLGCSAGEFVDTHHPRTECVNRISFN